MKFCKNCKTLRPLDQFHKDRSGKEGLASRCKPCKRDYYTSPASKHRSKLRMRAALAAATPEQREIIRQRRREWGAKNKDWLKDYQLKTDYSLTLEQYNAMLKEQGGLCAICEKPQVNGKPLFVDHNHKNGKIRGLLCMSCNRNLVVVDDSELHQKTIKYAERYL